MTRKILLTSGILSSLLYVGMNIFVAMRYEGYNAASQTVSELSAIGAPTRSLWVSLAIVYSLLMIGFGRGVWKSAGQNCHLRIVAGAMIINAVIGLFWPPMHQREVLEHVYDIVYCCLCLLRSSPNPRGSHSNGGTGNCITTVLRESCIL